MVQNGDLTSMIFTGNKTEFERTKKNQRQDLPRGIKVHRSSTKPTIIQLKSMSIKI
jgi:hypothetical protein